MDLLNELEDMAATTSFTNASELDDSEDIDAVTISRWQRLFDYTEAEAREHIRQQQDDLTALVPVALWNEIKDRQEALGYDRRTYSHWLQKTTDTHRTRREAEGSVQIGGKSEIEMEYLVRLEGPVDTAETIARAAGLSHPPQTLKGSSLHSNHTAQFCRITSQTKTALQTWLAKAAPTFRALFVSQSRARKDLSLMSKAPFLGIDTTLPQHRLQQQDSIPRPRQDEYPVWYFFYGTLADPARLERVFEHVEVEGVPRSSLQLIPAHLVGGNSRTWGGGKYKALVDGEANVVVQGSAFLVLSKEQEDALCFYETHMYEVVRCEIVFDVPGDEGKQVVQGCTFRFFGKVDENV